MFRARTPQGLPGHEFLLDFGVMHGSVLLAGIALGILTFFIPSPSLSLPLSFQLEILTVTIVPKSVHTQLVAKIDPNYIFKVLQNDVFLQRYLQVFQLV